MKDKDIGFIRKKILEFVTYLQIAALFQDSIWMYYFLTKLHFTLYFRDSLEKNFIYDTESYKRASHRHGCMVAGIHNTKKKKIYNLAKKSFHKNLALRIRLR